MGALFLPVQRGGWHRRHMRARILSVTVLLVLAAVGAPVAVPAQARVAAICRGLAVTIEGQPNTTITGTPGDDVILAPFGSHGSVDAGAGHDVVCVVPGARLPDYPDGPMYTVRGGDGDDIVDSTGLLADTGALFVPADAGSDTLYGGPAAELSYSFATDGRPSQVDDSPDVFLTGGGNDVVISGRLGSANPDVIDLGPGDDILGYAGTGAAPGGRVDGGPGRDRLAPTSIDLVDPPEDPLPAGDLVFDARTGLATLAGAPYLTFAGFEEYSFFEVGPSHRVTFRGTAAPEQVSVGQGVQDIRLGAGDDVLRQGFGALPPGAVRGGPGHDRIGLGVDRGIVVELDGLAVYGAGSSRVELAVIGFEDAVVHGRRVVLYGTRADNLLVVRTIGRALVTGKGGDDDLRLGIVAGRPGRDRLRLASGGPGDDVLRGSPLDDVLTGGPGHDRAFGHRGRDVCTAEVRRGCERR